MILSSALFTLSFSLSIVNSPVQERPAVAQEDNTGPGTHRGSVGGKLILPHAVSKAAYWGCSVLSEVNLEKSFEVQSDSCIKPLLENKEP